MVTPAIQNLIRENKTYRIDSSHPDRPQARHVPAGRDRCSGCGSDGPVREGRGAAEVEQAGRTGGQDRPGRDAGSTTTRSDEDDDEDEDEDDDDEDEDDDDGRATDVGTASPSDGVARLRRAPRRGTDDGHDPADPERPEPAAEEAGAESRRGQARPAAAEPAKPAAGQPASRRKPGASRPAKPAADSPAAAKPRRRQPAKPAGEAGAAQAAPPSPPAKKPARQDQASPTSTPARKQLGQMLVDLGFIDEAQLEAIYEEMRTDRPPARRDRRRTRPDQRGPAAPGDGRSCTACASSTSRRSSRRRRRSSSSRRTWPSSTRSCRSRYENDMLTVAMADPNNLQALDDLRNLLGIRRSIAGARPAQADRDAARPRPTRARRKSRSPT